MKDTLRREDLIYIKTDYLRYLENFFFKDLLCAKPRIYYMYVLICPKTEEPRYVGQSVDPIARLSGHIKKTLGNSGRKTKKESWIQNLMDLGIDGKIRVKVIETCDSTSIDSREVYYIKKYRSLYPNLTNTADGGRRGIIINGNHPMQGKKHSPLSIEKMRLIKMGEKNPVWGKRFSRTEEQKKNLSIGLKNSDKLKLSRQSTEYRDLISSVQSLKIYALDSISLEIVHTFKNSKDASEYFGVTRANINNARRFKRIVGKSLNTKYFIISEIDFNSCDDIKTYFNKNE
jgi:group I intron endonuclease